ncbi:hypothetical protein ACWEQL_12935 [Kitasatospora sp. NPDC004240]
MARLVVEGEELVVRLARWERLAAGRGGVRVPLTAVVRVTVERDWWRALRGVRGRGTWIPGALSLGSRPQPEGQDFAAVRPRRPVVCVDLRRPAPFVRLAVTDPDPEATARTIRAAAGL